MSMSAAAAALMTDAARLGIPRGGQVSVQLGILIRVQVQLARPEAPDWFDGDDPCASCGSDRPAVATARSYSPTRVL